MDEPLIAGHASVLELPRTVERSRISRLVSGPVALLFLATSSGIACGQMIVAHRGASHDAPENTLAAFQLAWQQEADGIEGDFRLTRDGHVVCIHDDTTERTAGVNLEVAKTSLAELRKLDVGRWKGEQFVGERIPTLQEIVAIVPEDKQIVIELKTGPEIVATVQRILNDSGLKPAQVLVISFNEDTVAESKRRLPGIRAHWLTGYQSEDETGETGPWSPTPPTVAQTVLRSRADGVGSEAFRDVFDQRFVNSLTTAGIREFHVWTVDDAADARYYQSLGASGITTNRPAYIRQELNRKPRR